MELKIDKGDVMWARGSTYKNLLKVGQDSGQENSFFYVTEFAVRKIEYFLNPWYN